MRIYLLGCGTPVAHADRFGSSYVIQVGANHVMFDCGPSTTSKLVQSGLRPTSVDHLFFTHHHFDHDVDYPCFLLSRWDESIGGENELQVFGPTLTEQLTHRLMDERDGAFAHDWIARVNHPLSLNAYTNRGGTLPRNRPVIHARDIGPGRVIRGPNWQATSAAALHVQPWLDSLAYRLDSEEGSVVVTGDTAPCETVAALAEGADVLISICVFVQADEEGSPEVQYMSGSTQVAQLARAAGVKKLVLVHQRPSLDVPGQMERAIRDITRVFDGDVVWGRELMVFEV